MLGKRSRPFRKDHSRSQLMADLASDSSIFSDINVFRKTKCSPFFSVPGLFIGLTTKNLVDSESAKSPTSPLDFKFFANFSNSLVNSPRSPAFEEHPKSWDCNRVGLSLVDSLNDESKNILLGSQLRISKTRLNSYKDDYVVQTSPKSLPKNYVMHSQTHLDSPKFEIGSFGNESADTSSSFYLYSSKSNSEVFSSDMKNTHLGSFPLASNLPGSVAFTIGDGNCFMGSLSASGIELSEDYTCIISYGPNPKTTHIFGDRILDNDTILSLNNKNNKIGDRHLPSDGFLSYCFSCNKKLENGEDIYMYRGDKAFCSCECRDKEILYEEGMEKSAIDEDMFIAGMALAS